MSARSLPHRWTAGIAALAASALIALGLPAQAQPGGGGGGGSVQGPGSPMNLDINTLLKAKSGAWADYTMSGKGQSVTIRYSLVERTPAKVALEINMPLPKAGGDMVSHFEFAPKGTDAWMLTAGKIQMGEQAMDMPAAQLTAAPPVKLRDPPGELIGSESVTTPMGVFACKHYRKALGPDPKAPALDMWLSDKVSPTGIVKQSLPQVGIEMMLAAVGNGAQSKLK